MAYFTHALLAEKIEEPRGGRAKWRLHEDLVMWSHILQKYITVPAGFVTDFASVPRLPFIYAMTGDTAHASAVIHDWLIREEKMDWPTAALVFREAMESESVPAWRRWLMYQAVRFPRDV
jgi:hypothetical protein